MESNDAPMKAKANPIPRKIAGRRIRKCFFIVDGYMI
jgi:hypothetical protein